VSAATDMARAIFTRRECLSCGLCCIETEMILLPSDIESIRKLGYLIKEFAIFKDGYFRLRNVNGHCYFYDPVSGRCRIYRYRPLGCRIYPIIYVEGLGPAVDSECPLASTLTQREWKVGVKLLSKYVKLLNEFYKRTG